MEAGWKASRLGGGLARLPRLPFIYLRRRERGVQGLTIEAKSIESARGFYDALSAFHPEMLEDTDCRYRVAVQLISNDRIIDVLNALEQHVTERDTGPARLELDGRNYTLHVE
jgi:hypothetical protein